MRMLTVIVIFAMSLCGACQNGVVQTKATFDEKSATLATMNPSKLNVSHKGGGTVTVDTTGPTYTTNLEQFDPTGQFVVSSLDSVGGGATSREFILPVGSSRMAVFRSGTNFSASVDKLIQGTDGAITIEGLKISSDAASATAAAIEAYRALEPTWKQWSADQRDAFVKQQETLQKTGDAAAPIVLQAIKWLGGVP